MLKKNSFSTACNKKKEKRKKHRNREMLIFSDKKKKEKEMSHWSALTDKQPPFWPSFSKFIALIPLIQTNRGNNGVSLILYQNAMPATGRCLRPFSMQGTRWSNWHGTGAVVIETCLCHMWPLLIILFKDTKTCNQGQRFVEDKQDGWTVL